MDSRWQALLAAFALFASTLAAAQPTQTWVRGKAATPPAGAAAVPAAFRHPAFPAERTRRLALEPLAAREKSLSAGEGTLEKRMAVGTARDIRASAAKGAGDMGPLDWVPAAAGGWVARAAFTSPGAASLRVSLFVQGLPAAAELRFAGSARAHDVLGPVTGEQAAATVRSHGTYWTPVTAGETQTVEIWLPSGARPTDVSFRSELVSHLFADAAEQFKNIGAAEGCHEDVVCVARDNPAVERAARSVVKLLFTRNGSTFVCSGTLISDGSAGSQVPYVYTAAHCVGSQAVAATLNTFWFFEASTCGGSSPGQYRQLSGGATLLHADEASDVALLRLSERAPEGAWFSGWDAAPLAEGNPVVALHHPRGDLKKVGTGRRGAEEAGSRYQSVSWLSGSTEGGSSGSGLFTEAGGEYVLRGGLRGGPASCAVSGRDDPSNRDNYSRIDQSAAVLRQWLSAPAAPLADYTDMWWDPQEPGWGLSIIQHASNRVFVTWFRYGPDGRPTWLVMPDAAWRSAVALEGTLYRTTGTAAEAPYDPARSTVAPAGTARIEFVADDRARVVFSVETGTVVKEVRRQAF